MEYVSLKIECYSLTRSNSWSTFPTDFELSYPASSYMEDMDQILKDLLNDEMANNFYRIKVIVLDKNGEYFNDHDFMMYLKKDKCVILYDTDYYSIFKYRDIHPGDIVTHFKYENNDEHDCVRNIYRYKVVDFGYYAETNEPAVIYQALYEPFKTYIRPLNEFMGLVDHEECPNSNQVFRFYKIGFFDKYK